MVFSSAIFLFAFLPIVCGLYFIMPNLKVKNALLIVASLIFYGFGEPIYVLLMIASIIVNYLFGLFEYLAYTKNHSAVQKLMFVISIVVNIGVLGVFKYAGFFVENINYVTGLSIHVPSITLPIGISFFTFQALSYVIDVYRKPEMVQKNLFKLILYISFFPQLIAGPIIRYNEIQKQIDNRVSTIDKTAEGISKFIRGLTKKLIIANAAGHIADSVFALNINEYNFIVAWAGAIAYAIQIYYDFSGYSDMAVGLGKMFGFEFCMNFNYPYIAKSITEFWRRWHISLSSWFRDYVYIPLGGNRVSKSRHIFNLMVVWFLTGLWHGAAWNFVAWGLYYGIILIIEKYILSPVLDKLPSVVRHIYSIVLVVIGWVLFFSPSLGGAARYLGMMLGAGAHGVADRESLYLLTTNLVLWIILIIGSTPLTDVRYQHMLRQKKWNTTLLNGIVYAVLFILCIAYLVTETYNPFLYFRF